MTRSLQYAWPFPSTRRLASVSIPKSVCVQWRKQYATTLVPFRNHLKAGKTSYQANRRLLTDNPSPERK